jgi:hypothetical protein
MTRITTVVLAFVLAAEMATGQDSFPGTKTRPAQEKAVETLSIYDFPDVWCDGKHDDTAGLQNAIYKAGGEFNAATSKLLMWPRLAGHPFCTTTKPLHVPSYAHWVADPGMAIQAGSNWAKQAGDAILDSESPYGRDKLWGMLNASIAGLTLRGNAPNADYSNIPDYGIHFHNGFNATLDHVFVEVTALEGYLIDNDRDSEVANLNGCIAVNVALKPGLKEMHAAIHITWTDYLIYGDSGFTTSANTYGKRPNGGIRVGCWLGGASAWMRQGDCHHNDIGVVVDGTGITVDAGVRTDFDFQDGWLISGSDNLILGARSFFDCVGAPKTYDAVRVTGGNNTISMFLVKDRAPEMICRNAFHDMNTSPFPNHYIGSSGPGEDSEELRAENPLGVEWNSGHGLVGYLNKDVEGSGKINVGGVDYVLLPAGDKGPYEIREFLRLKPRQRFTLAFAGKKNPPRLSGTEMIQTDWSPAADGRYHSLSLFSPDGLRVVSDGAAEGAALTKTIAITCGDGSKGTLTVSQGLITGTSCR